MATVAGSDAVPAEGDERRDDGAEGAEGSDADGGRHRERTADGGDRGGGGGGGEGGAEGGGGTGAAGTKLWVANLAADLQQADLVAIFERYGRVLSVDWKIRFAFVELDSPEAARQAMNDLQGVKLLDAPLRIDLYRDRILTATGAPPTASEATPSHAMPDPRPGEGRLYLRNLDYRTGWQDVKDKFLSLGSVYRANILAGPDGKPSGRGQIIFHTFADAQRIAEEFQTGIEIRGRRVLLTLDTSRAPAPRHDDAERGRPRGEYVGRDDRARERAGPDRYRDRVGGASDWRDQDRDERSDRDYGRAGDRGGGSGSDDRYRASDRPRDAYGEYDREPVPRGGYGGYGAAHDADYYRRKGAPAAYADGAPPSSYYGGAGRGAPTDLVGGYDADRRRDDYRRGDPYYDAPPPPPPSHASAGRYDDEPTPRDYGRGRYGDRYDRGAGPLPGADFAGGARGSREREWAAPGGRAPPPGPGPAYGDRPRDRSRSPVRQRYDDRSGYDGADYWRGGPPASGYRGRGRSPPPM